LQLAADRTERNLADRTFRGQQQGVAFFAYRQHAVVRGDPAWHGGDQASIELERIERRPLQVQLFGQGLYQLRAVDVFTQQQFSTEATAHRAGDRHAQLFFAEQAFFHQTLAQRGALRLGQCREFMGGLVPGHTS